MNLEGALHDPWLWILVGLFAAVAISAIIQKLRK